MRILPTFLLCWALTVACWADSIVPKHSRKFTRYDGQFVETPWADGDSFKVRIGEDEFVFRLYYVDAPESDERFPDRNEEQAQYFGITPQESVAAGKAAKAFVRQRLAGKSLTVWTRWATALGSSKLPRYYAVVEVDGRGLADLLVENGLARLHGTKVGHPDGRKADNYIAGLAELEKTAEAKKLGAWATSKPELRHPVVEETVEAVESPRWAERLISGGIGASAVGVAWLMTALWGRRRRGDGSDSGE